MWKSVRFQQVFRLFAPPDPMWKSPENILHNSHNCAVMRVTSIPASTELGTKIREIVPFHCEIACQKTIGPSGSP